MQSRGRILAAVATLTLVGCAAEPSPSPNASVDGVGSLVVIVRYEKPPPGTRISIGGYGAFADLRGPAGRIAEDVELAFPGPVELAAHVSAGDYRLAIRVRPASDAITNGVRDFGPVVATCDAFVPVLAGGTTALVVTVVGGESCTIDRPDAGLVTTLIPSSAGGVEVGVPQEFAMPHCGINSPIDFDGSFWDPVLPVPEPLDYDNAAGTIRLTDPAAAVFVSATGRQLRLTRHTGDKVFLLCE